MECRSKKEETGKERVWDKISSILSEGKERKLERRTNRLPTDKKKVSNTERRKRREKKDP